MLGAVGERPVEWTAAEQRAYTRPAGPQCAVSLLHAGSAQPVDALAHFCGRRSWRDSFTSSSSSLNGGGAPGILTNVGLEQANALGASLRSRYVDPAAQGGADVGRARLLPASWEAARGLVAARSTLVERTVFTVSGLALSLTPNPNPNPDPDPDLVPNPKPNPDPSPSPSSNPQPHPSPHPHPPSHQHRDPHQASGVLAGLFPTEAAAGTMEAEVALNVQRGAGDAEEFMVINVQRCPRLKALFRHGEHICHCYDMYMYVCVLFRQEAPNQPVSSP